MYDTLNTVPDNPVGTVTYLSSLITHQQSETVTDPHNYKPFVH